jgi:hypothetical protein
VAEAALKSSHPLTSKRKWKESPNPELVGDNVNGGVRAKNFMEAVFQLEREHR